MAKGEVRSVTFNWLTKLLEKNPDYYADKKDHKLYEFSSGREFRGDPAKVGTAYNDDE